MDYQAELKRVEESTGDYWKPKAGQYKVKGLSEIEDLGMKQFEEGKDPQARASLDIEVSGKAYTWEFPKGRTKASTYGQLVQLGATKGKITGVEFTIVVVGEGQNIRYTIVA